MITRNILQYLEDNGLGTRNAPKTNTNTLQLERFPAGYSGLAIFSRGAPMGKGMRLEQAFDIYSRQDDPTLGYEKLEETLELLTNSLTVCVLPVLEDNKQYTNVSIVPVSNIENAGVDENNRVLYSATATVTYNKTS